MYFHAVLMSLFSCPLSSPNFELRKLAAFRTVPLALENVFRVPGILCETILGSILNCHRQSFQISRHLAVCNSSRVSVRCLSNYVLTLKFVASQCCPQLHSHSGAYLKQRLLCTACREAQAKCRPWRSVLMPGHSNPKILGQDKCAQCGHLDQTQGMCIHKSHSILPCK